MLQALVITLREGFEAFLIVAISLVVPPQVGARGADPRGPLGHRRRRRGQRARRLPALPLAQPGMARRPARAGRRRVGRLDDRPHVAHRPPHEGRHRRAACRRRAARPGVAAFTGVFLFTLLMISREGMETALLLMQLHETTNLVLGAAVGSLAAAGVAWLWSRYGHRINLGAVLPGDRDLPVRLRRAARHQGRARNVRAAVPALQRDHPQQHRVVGTRQPFGHVLTYLLVILPLAWIAIKSLVSKSPIFPPPSAPVARGSAAR